MVQNTLEILPLEGVVHLILHFFNGGPYFTVVLEITLVIRASEMKILVLMSSFCLPELSLCQRLSLLAVSFL